MFGHVLFRLVSGVIRFVERVALGMHRRWTSARIILSALRISWVSAASVIIGAVILLYAAQAKDLFLDVRGGYVYGSTFWIAFYVIFVLFWVIPVYVSSRWILARVEIPAAIIDFDRTRALKVTIPRYLAVSCFTLLLLSQVTALAEAPYVLQEANTLRDPKREITLILFFMFALYGILVPMRRLFIIPTELDNAKSWRRFFHGILLAWVCLATVLLLGFALKDFTDFVVTGVQATVTALDNLIGWQRTQYFAWAMVWTPFVLLVSYILSFVRFRWIRIAASLVLIFNAIAVLVPMALAFALLLLLDFRARIFGLMSYELDAPLGVGHLAVLPMVTLMLNHMAWRLLAPEGRIARLLTPPTDDPRVSDRDLPAPPASLDTIFAAVVACCLGIILAQFFFHPVDITQYVGRALLLPLLLGLLVPVFTFVSYWSFRWHAPIVLTVVLVLAFVVPDSNDVRTTRKEANRPTLEDTVRRWQVANACGIAAGDAIRPCPSPIIVSVAGGASRSAFLLGAVIGKLLDERNDPSGATLRPFEKQLFAVSGVSGGSLGATVTYAALADSLLARRDGGLGPPPCKAGIPDADWFAPHIDPTRNASESWRDCLQLLLAGDFLSPVMVSLVSNDLLGLSPRGDRATILETAWERRYARFTARDSGEPGLSRSMVGLRQDVLARSDVAWLPILVLGGTSVSTGRRILTSDIDTLLSAKLNNLRGRMFRDAYDLHELLAPTLSVANVSFSPDGKHLLISHGGESSMRIWDAMTGTVVREITHPDLDASEAIWSPDNVHILARSGRQQHALVWRAADGALIATLEGSPHRGVFSPDGNRLLLEQASGLVVYDVAGGSRVDIPFPENDSLGGRATFSLDGRSVLNLRKDGAVLVYDAATGAVESTIPHVGHYDIIGLTRDRRFVFASGAGEAGRFATMVDVQTGEKVFDHVVGMNRLASFDPDGTRLLYARADGAIRIRTMQTGTEIVVSGSESDSWVSPSFSRDGQRVLLWDGTGGAIVLDAATGAEQRVIRGQEGKIHQAAWHPSGSYAFTWSDNGLGRFWNIDTGEELYVIRGTESGTRCDKCDVRLSTAATMSARFPVISPHGNVRNGRTLVDRVVDGGYYENFGALTALELADELRHQFGLDPRIILINNEPQASGMSCLTRDSQIALPRPPSRITFATLRAPINALWATSGARGTHAAVDLCSRMGGGDKFAFITVTQDKRDAEATLSMSWWLSKHVQQFLDRQVDTATTRNNAEAFRTIESWRR